MVPGLQRCERVAAEVGFTVGRARHSRTLPHRGEHWRFALLAGNPLVGVHVGKSSRTVREDILPSAADENERHMLGLPDWKR